MDLAACARARVHHPGACDPRWQAAAGERCDLPVTARGVVTLVATNYGLFEPTGYGFRMREIAPGLTVDEVRARDRGTADGGGWVETDRSLRLTLGEPGSSLRRAAERVRAHGEQRVLDVNQGR